MSTNNDNSSSKMGFGVTNFGQFEMTQVRGDVEFEPRKVALPSFALSHPLHIPSLAEKIFGGETYIFIHSAMTPMISVMNRCLASNLDNCRSTQAHYQLSHPRSYTTSYKYF